MLHEGRGSEIALSEVRSADDAADALAFLEASEEIAGSPLVDESEQVALIELRDGAPQTGWKGFTATAAGEVVGYAGVRDETDGAVADLAVDRLRPGAAAVARILFDTLAQEPSTTVWVRDAGHDDVTVAAEAGFAVSRRLFVMGRGLADYRAAPDPPGGVLFRSFEPGEDDAAIVALLADAYAGTPDAGWDPAGFAEIQRRDWFDPADLLVASGRNGHVAGAHWTKRRGGGTGEVYNLAVHPDFQGLGLGRALFRAGLHHLRRRGCDDVILWVDEANAAAVRLYASEGFVRRWEDVAFSQTPT